MKVLIKWSGITVIKENINLGCQRPNIDNWTQNFAIRISVSYWKMFEIQTPNKIIYEEYLKSSH